MDEQPFFPTSLGSDDPNLYTFKQTKRDIFIQDVPDQLDLINDIKLGLNESLKELKLLNNSSAEKDFCEHNIKKALKWLERIK